MPSQQKALVLESRFGELVVKDVDIPKPAADEVLIRVEAAALNPIDWKILAFSLLVETYPCIMGGDGAGTIVEVGPGVEGFAVGDRVFGQGWYDAATQALQGTFQSYALAPVGSLSKLPPNVSFDGGATLPTGIATAVFPLYNDAEGAPSLRLPPAWEERGRGKFAGKPIFILAGASSMGQYTIQFARLSGFSPIVTTASLRNAELLKSLGATHVLDRTLSPETISKEARAIAGGYFNIVYDAVSVPETLEAGYSATAPDGDFVILQPTPIPGAEEPPKKRVHMAHGVFRDPINVGIAKKLLAKLPELLENGDIKPNPVEILPGGLRAVPAGLQRLRNNQISGVKLVVRPRETE